MIVKEKNSSQYYANVEQRQSNSGNYLCIHPVFPLWALCHLPNHIPLQGALKGNLCPHYQKWSVHFISLKIFVRKQFHFQAYSCGKASFSSAVFQVHFYSETFCFAYDSAQIQQIKRGKMWEVSVMWTFLAHEEAVLHFRAVLCGCTVHPLDSLHLEN